jgi:uncharacterized protein YqgV (UPF0045/DUF77 family)
VYRVEFTIEPFVEGHPGQHVNAAIAAVLALGLEVEVGPFGSACLVAAEQVGEVIAAIVTAATAHGASHVNVDVTDEESV